MTASATVTFSPATSWRVTGSSTSTPTTGDASISFALESTGPVATGAATIPWWAHSGEWGLSCKLHPCASQMNIKHKTLKEWCPLWAFFFERRHECNLQWHSSKAVYLLPDYIQPTKAAAWMGLKYKSDLRLFAALSSFTVCMQVSNIHAIKGRCLQLLL